MKLLNLALLSLMLFSLTACGSRISISELALISEHKIEINKLDFDNTWDIGGAVLAGGDIIGSNVPPVVDNSLDLPLAHFPNEINTVWMDLVEQKIYHVNMREPALSVRAKTQLIEYGIPEAEGRLVLVYLKKGKLGVWVQGGGYGEETKLNKKMFLKKGIEVEIVSRETMKWRFQPREPVIN